MPGSRLVAAPATGVYRVAKGLDSFVFRPPRGALPDGNEPVLDGNRWDDPSARFASLYCATTAEAAFGETIARYRETDGLIGRIAAFLNSDPDPAYDFELAPGRVPPDYFADRYLGHVAVDPDVRFVDVDHPHTHAAATLALRGLLRQHRLREVDRGVMFHADRRLTRPIARYYWTLAQSPDHRDWAGLRYESRLSAGWECWAPWEPSPFACTSPTSTPSPAPILTFGRRRRGSASSWNDLPLCSSPRAAPTSSCHGPYRQRDP